MLGRSRSAASPASPPCQASSRASDSSAFWSASPLKPMSMPMASAMNNSPIIAASGTAAIATSTSSAGGATGTASAGAKSAGGASGGGGGSFAFGSAGSRMPAAASFSPSPNAFRSGEISSSLGSAAGSPASINSLMSPATFSATTSSITSTRGIAPPKKPPMATEKSEPLSRPPRARILAAARSWRSCALLGFQLAGPAWRGPGDLAG